MRHRVYGKKLGLDKDGRANLFKSLVRSLIINETIETTDSKAKAIKGLVDKLVNQAKSPNTRRLLHQFLVDKKLVEKLVKEIIPGLSKRTSGYTSIVKMGPRLGDNAMMVRMSLLVEKPIVEKGVKKIARPKVI